MIHQFARATLAACFVCSLFAPALADECQLPGATTLEVGKRSLCAYGHWLEGQVTIRVSGGEISANGIRIFPPLRAPVVPSDSAYVADPRSVEFTNMMPELEQLQYQLAADGLEKPQIQAQVVAYLKRKEGVASVERAAIGGDFFEIAFQNGYRQVVGLGAVIPKLSRVEEEAARCRSLQGAYRGLIDGARDGWLKIYTTGVEVSIGPARRHDLDVVAALDNAIAGKAPLDSLTWDNKVIPYFVARELRNPRQFDSESEGVAK